MATAANIWLHGPRDYAQGLAILSEYLPADDTNLWFLQLGENSMSRREMVEAMQRIVDEAKRNTLVRPETNGKPAPTSAAREEQRVLAAGDGYDGAELPPQLVELRNKTKEKLSERDYLRAQLEVLPRDEDRLASAMRIAQLDDEIVSAYARMDTWRDTHRDPGVASAPAKSALDLLREQKNIESYLARHNSGARVASDAKVNEWKERVQQIKTTLNSMA